MKDLRSGKLAQVTEWRRPEFANNHAILINSIPTKHSLSSNTMDVGGSPLNSALQVLRPQEEVEREQLLQIARNARVDSVASVAWPLVLSAVLISDTNLLGNANYGPIVVWLTCMALWAATANFLSARSVRDAQRPLKLERRHYCQLYFVNSAFWSFGVVIIMWGRGHGASEMTEAEVLVQVLFAMLVTLGLGVTLAIQNSPHLKVFLCAIGPVSLLPALYLLIVPDNVNPALGILLLFLSAWIIAIGTRIHASFTARVELQTSLAKARDHAEAMQDRAEDASRAKSAFMASMSHELRTPLNAIIGFSEILGSRLFPPNDDRNTDYAWDIHSSGKHLLSLIEDILHIQKIESGAKLYNMEPGDLAAELSATRALLTERAHRRNIELSLELPDTAPSIIDGRAIRQVVINLVANAIEHTPEKGEVAVRLTERRRTWHLEVVDTGVGIPDDLVPHVFDAFVTSADKPYATNEKGTGLGLNISREIVHAHGGRIWFDTSSEGTRFSILLPRKSATPNADLQNSGHVAIEAQPKQAS